MNPKQKNTLLAAAILTGVLSLPLTWLTIQNASFRFNSPIPHMMGSASMVMNVNLTGLNGNVKLLLPMPLWFVIGVAIGASALQLMRNTNSFEIPRIAEWLAAGFAVIWTTLPVLIGLTTGKVTPGVGWLLGMVSAAIPLYCLIAEMKPSQVPPALPTADQSPFDRE